MTSALDLFAGAGGWSLACQRLGIAEVGVENMPAALATRAAAGFKSHETSDVWDLDYFDLAAAFDALLASPPCQTFSQAGNGAGRKALDAVLALIASGVWKDRAALRAAATHLGDDERTALVLLPLHAVWAMRPRWVAWEQVPTVLPVWEACAEVLRAMGYRVWTGKLNSEQYGVPQTRTRAFLLAHAERPVFPPPPTHSTYYPRNKGQMDLGVLPWVSLGDALDRVPPGYRLCPTNLRPNAALRRPDEPAPTMAFGHEYPRWVYERPATTVVGTFHPEVIAAPGYRTTVSRQDAPESIRVSVAEAGVLQSFPADFPWQGAERWKRLQVGNAVPPLLAEHVLSSLEANP